MKHTSFQYLLLFSLILATMTIIFTGCGQPSAGQASLPPSLSVSETASSAGASGAQSQAAASASNEVTPATELYVQFGDEGAPFALHLYDNPTASAIARHVGTADWRIPLYNYDGYDNWEVMQYYDIPSRYEIPARPEAITAAQTGTVYYSEPNRIVLFYGDAEISDEYTPVGYFDATQEFVDAVRNNPVLEGWSNKIIHIKAN